MPSVQDALYRFGGMYGKAYREGVLLSNAVEVSGAIDLNRIEVVLVGQTKVGYKPGREAREGTINIQKIDSAWDIEFWEYIDQRRKFQADPTQPRPVLRQFDLKLEIADPDALGTESWQLHGCQIWRLPLGFSVTDDIINRELPMTWESEDPVSAFTVDPDYVATPYVRQT